MATSYSYVIDEFKDKITDYDLAAFSDDLQDEILNSILRKACRKFKVYTYPTLCKGSLRL